MTCLNKSLSYNVRKSCDQITKIPMIQHGGSYYYYVISTGKKVNCQSAGMMDELCLIDTICGYLGEFFYLYKLLRIVFCVRTALYLIWFVTFD